MTLAIWLLVTAAVLAVVTLALPIAGDAYRRAADKRDSR